MSGVVPDTPVDVRKRGKSFINVDCLPYVQLPTSQGQYMIPILVYDGIIYTTAEHATRIATHLPDNTEIMDFPTLETMRVTAGKHKFSRSFVSNFGAIRVDGQGVYRCEKSAVLRRHIFIDLIRFAQFANVAEWNPKVFAAWNAEMQKGWEQEVQAAVTQLPQQEDWRAKAFCTPTGEFLGRKPGNRLTYDEQYRYGERVASLQRKTRADKVVMPWELSQTPPLPKLHRDSTVIIHYGKDMRVAVDPKKKRITITTN